MNRWILKSKITDEVSQNLFKYPPIIRQLLFNRGIYTEAAASLFFQPAFERLNSPFLFHDMEKAVDRIWQAIDAKEVMCVYGDYDADAVTACAVLGRTFAYVDVPVKAYIPDRFTEGYGLNVGAFEKLKADGVTLVITVDCGTNSVEIATWCKENGVDLIITDHHEITGEVPEAYALINPKNPRDTYPDSQITGVGVAYKLACGMLSHEEKVKKRATEYVQGWEKWLLDLVAIGTVADCHSLLAENRILVHFGLKVLRKTKWAGLQELLNLVFEGREVDYSAKTIGFSLAPRINAAGRLEHAGIALELLLEDDPYRAHELVVKLEAINERRKHLTSRIVTEAKEQAHTLIGKKIILLSHPEWHKGVVGLVAGKLCNEFGKPTIILEQGEEFSTGSVRSVGAFDVVSMLRDSKEYLHAYGGHKQAAGLTVTTKNLSNFYDSLLSYAHDKLNDEDLLPFVEVEDEVSDADVNMDTARLLSLFEPYGAENPAPLFLHPKIEVASTKLVGKNGQHVQFRTSGNVEGIVFNAPDFGNEAEVEAVVEITKDTWMGREKVKLKIVEFK